MTFVYTPRIGADAKLSAERTINFEDVEGYNNMTEILDAVAAKEIGFYTRKDKDGNIKPSVCTILFGKLDWNPIEGLRRSDEFHAFVDAYSEDNPEVKTSTWKLDTNGRKPNNGGPKSLNFKGSLPEGRSVDSDSESPIVENDPVNHKDGSVTYSWTVKTIDTPVKEKVKRETKAELQARADALQAELNALKAANGEIPDQDNDQGVTEDSE